MGRGWLKDIRLVILVFSILIASFFIYILYSTRRIQIIFSDEGDIVGDGEGPYVKGNRGVEIIIDIHEQPAVNEERVFLSTLDSTRCVFVKFLDVVWKDFYLRDKPPRMSSKQYSIDLIFGIDLGIVNSTLARMRIGERLEPTSIMIVFYDRETGEIQGRASRVSPDLPVELYEDGHAYIIKENENSWMFDVDAWFYVAIGPTWPPTTSMTYYIKLDFDMTLQIKGIL